jgi:hypothetical protein
VGFFILFSDIIRKGRPDLIRVGDSIGWNCFIGGNNKGSHGDYWMEVKIITG